ncbi:3-phosphoshikimate 1-carboxyvinyltransferase [Peribacillus alkalitolerans]|uniref:3-phosphoshikimate 1-carboxyvinyltransferase n=1 Tax=Peribacillus alkalitolerans TaxID=1550385 RepID=UPI0013D4DBAF|nr:3-phosphoshikimate 1-carboxyvinyltransferase [Peribacillus alkalitolerans]
MKVLPLNTNALRLKGEIQVPGDKSISHRSIMLGSIAEGKTTVSNFLPGADCLSTISCFSQMGIVIDRNGDSVTIHGKGVNGLQEPEQLLDVGNSGTTIRLIMGILAGQSFFSVLAGDESIARRPMVRTVTPLREMGAVIDGRMEGKRTPISIRGGNLTPITYELPVASAQVKSCVLLAGLFSKGTTTVIEKEKTRDHTERMLAKFGVNVEIEGQKISIEGEQTLKGTHINVPGDISSAAFFLVAGALVENSEVRLNNVGINPTRSGIIDVLKEMGADLEIHSYNENVKEEPVADLIIRTSSLKGTEINGSLIPRLIDEIPIIALLATQAEGKTIISDAKELRVKETDRIQTVVEELSKLGADIEATEDGMIINGKTPLNGGSVNSRGDHRIGMMLSVAALLCKENVELEDSEAINVSYPNFFEHLQSLLK